MFGDIGRAFGSLFNPGGSVREAAQNAIQNAQSRPDPAEELARRRREELINQQEQAIKEFDAQRPENQAALVRRQDSAIRQALQDRMRGVRTEASRRGLLYSGQREAAEADVRLRAGQGFVQARQASQQAISRARNQMQNLLDRMRLNKQEEAIMQADMAYDLALQSAEEQRGVIGSLMGIAGTAAGLALASKGGSQSASSTPMTSNQTSYGTGYLGVDTNLSGRP